MNHLTLAIIAILALPGTAAIAADAPPASVTASMGTDGRVKVSINNDPFFTLNPISATPAWSFGSTKPVSLRQDGETRQFIITVGGKSIAGEASAKAQGPAAELRYVFTARDDMEVAALALSADFAATDLAGGSWRADDKQGTFPLELQQTHLFNGSVRKVSVQSKSKNVEFSFPQPTSVLIQDSRQWGPAISIRIGRQGPKLTKGERYELPLTISTGVQMAVTMDKPIVITAGEDWIPLTAELEIEPGSALDFSKMGFVDAPAGKHGWLQTRGRDFVFEKQPDKPQRFYGVNFCFNAHYIPHERIDQLCDRLLRLGYNAVRFHHYEGALTGSKPGFDWLPERIDQLDYFFAACKKRGIYVTTDLYVSRPVGAQQVGMSGSESWAYKFKVLIPVHEPAFADWEKFTRQLLDRVNPHTGMRWADDPTLAWLSMINEGNIGNYWSDIRTIPQWTTAWNQWLAKRYPDRDALAKAWGEELKAGENPSGSTVALPNQVNGATPRHRDVTVFVAETELAMFKRMEKFLRDDIKCKALLTNMNAWTNHAPNQLVRAQMDYVDDHFYVDHPQFIEKPWNLPSRSDNDNPVKRGAPGGRGGNNLRLLDRPYTVSEYNYSGPGRYRGVGGILTGAMGALQDWGAIWRFAYSHSDKNLFTPAPMGYFDLVTDPLNQAADRAAVMLYLRGDLKTSPSQVALMLTRDELQNPPSQMPSMGSGPSWVTWVTKLGSLVVDSPADAPKDSINLFSGWGNQKPQLTAFGTDPAALVAEMKQRGIISANNPTDPSKNVFMSETGEFLIDGPRALLQFDTEKTAGGYADPGQSIRSERGGVEVSDLSIGATVFVTSIDNRPIRTSKRLLVTHLTDLQNTESTYAESARQTLLVWGKLPHLVRAGTAKVSITLPQGAYTVYSLSTSGRRTSEVKSQVTDGRLTFTCDVKGSAGAQMLYEVVASAN